MLGRYSKGVRLERFDYAKRGEPEKIDMKSEGFGARAPDDLEPWIARARVASRGFCYRMAEADENAPGYLSIYELEEDDLEAAALAFEAQRVEHRRQEQGQPAVQIADAATWRRVGPDFRSAGSRGAAVSGLLAIEALCTDPSKLEDYNRWYNGTHVPDMLGTGLYHTAYRFENISPEPGRGAYLALYETDQDPLSAQRAFWQDFRPIWIETGRVIDTMKVVSARSYRQLSFS